MPSWKGNIKNPAPNSIKESIDRSEKRIGANRSNEIRRDKDSQKNITIGFYEIDETILSHLEQIQLQVEDAGHQIKVPIFYGAPEKWTAARRDGYIRDKQGKLILPAIIFKRTTSETDQNFQFFNRYLEVSALKLYSPKNKYTKFNLMTDSSAPRHEIYNIVMPSHMIMTYHFIIWTEHVEQMNRLVERFRFETQDYWGSKTGLRFRTRVESYGHTVELQANDDRVVKTEFDLTIHGYILPDMMTQLDTHSMTTRKSFTPKKIIFNAELVNSAYDMESLNPNKEKWRNPSFPNLSSNTLIETPIPQWIPTAPTPSNDILQILNDLRLDQIDEREIDWHTAPVGSNIYGEPGWMAYDENYFYVYAIDKWWRVSINTMDIQNHTTSQLAPVEGSIGQDENYFYVYTNQQWHSTSISSHPSVVPPEGMGREGKMYGKENYFYIYTKNKWRRIITNLFNICQ